MLKKERTSKTNIAILILVASVALVLSIFAYQYSTFTSDKIVDIASHEVRSNARRRLTMSVTASRHCYYLYSTT
jgi:hypothetical protein